MKNKYMILIVLFFTVVGCACTVKNQQQDKSKPAIKYYTEKYRPQFHFSPEEKWMNDPNGMVYYKGEYHLFYQYYPDSTVWGPMHWGHAISTDLVHWEHLPVALFPDEHGYIFSGSAVVDWENTSGLGKDGEPPLVAIFTYHDAKGDNEGKIDYETQGIVYSNDKGRTWTKYGEPVLKNPGIKDFRDPKVSWNKDADKWIMTLAVQDHVEFYSSPNLIAWQKESEFGKELGAHGGVWECPDLFQLEIDETGERKWILFVSISPGGPNGGSATQYFVGDFNGKTFTTQQTATKWIDYGKDNYAGVTWSDIPEEDGRRLFIGWMNNWQYANQIPTSTWRGACTLPRTLKLTKIYDEYLLLSSPVEEFNKLKSVTRNISAYRISENRTLHLEQELPLEINLTFKTENNTSTNFSERFGILLSNKKEESLKIGYDNVNKRFFIDRQDTGWDNPSNDYAGIHYAPYIVNDPILELKLIIDESSVELFAVDGLVVMTERFFSSEKFTNLSLFADKGEIELIEGNTSQLSRIW